LYALHSASVVANVRRTTITCARRSVSRRRVNASPRGVLGSAVQWPRLRARFGRECGIHTAGVELVIVARPYNADRAPTHRCFPRAKRTTARRGGRQIGPIGVARCLPGGGRAGLRYAAHECRESRCRGPACAGADGRTRQRLSGQRRAGRGHLSEVALRVGADPRAVERVVRLLTDVGVFEQLDGGRVGLTALGGMLRADAPGRRAAVRSWSARSGTGWRTGTWSTACGPASRR
jgi:hypothetical protein